MTEPAIITTDNPPHCALCRERRFQTWNPKIGPGPGVQRAEYYVLVRYTSGLIRHLCAACQTETQDTILARFVPKEA